jgi:hypothetical protein
MGVRQGHVGQTDLGGHEPLRAVTEADENALARLQLGNAVAAKGFHVDEDIRLTLALCEEAEAAQAVEPLHDRRLQSAGRHDLDMGPWQRELGRVKRRRLVKGENPKGLQTPGALNRLDQDPRSFVCGLVAVAPQAGHMEQNIGHAVVRDYEAETFGHIEPFDPAADLDKLESALLLGRLSNLAAALIKGGILLSETERIGAVIASHEITQTRIMNPILKKRITSS